jgi:hypothetical protein
MVSGARADLARRQAEHFFRHHHLPAQAEIEIELAIPQYMGLGSAAMLGLTVARALATLHGCGPENIVVGNGSDEVLAHAFLALLKHPAPLLFPDITYSFYPVYCRLYDIAFETVPLRDDFSIAVDDYARPAGGIVLPNPNAPTGRAMPLAEVRRLLEAHRDIAVVIDEAYNANPASMAASLAVLGAIAPARHGRRLALLGAMKELGDLSAEFHAGIAPHLIEAGVAVALLVGPEMQPLAKALGRQIDVRHVGSAEAAQAELQGVLAADDVLSPCYQQHA